MRSFHPLEATVSKRAVIAGLVLVSMVGCGKAEQKQAEEASKKIEQGAQAMQQGADQMARGARQGSDQMSQGLQQMAQGFQQMAQGSAKAVDYELLKALLPNVSGWTRSDTKGEQLTMPVSYSRAETRYQKDDSRIELEITDTALSQMLIAPMSMFLATGYAERSDDGFKRAAKVGGFPAMEEWDNGSKRGEITALVGNRYMVHGTGEDVKDLAPVRQIVEAVDLSKLAALK
jgi:X-X-X-Leu-X-X-Gly heptad repeat protein